MLQAQYHSFVAGARGLQFFIEGVRSVEAGLVKGEAPGEHGAAAQLPVEAAKYIIFRSNLSSSCRIDSSIPAAWHIRQRIDGQKRFDLRRNSYGVRRSASRRIGAKNPIAGVGR